MDMKKLDAKFEKMSRECANKITGTYPTAKKKVVKKTKKK